MSDQGNWSLNLGRYGGVHVRLHMLTLLFAVFTLFLAQAAVGQGLMWTAALSLLILLGSVVLHEAGHLVAAARLGGYVDEIVIGPLGGFAPVRVPGDPRRELAATLAGPAVNLAICAACVPLLALAELKDIRGLLHPLQPENLIGGDSLWLVGLKLTLWINWLLLLVNLLPAFPFDGARALRNIVLVLRPGLGHHATVLLVTRVAKVVAVALAVLAFLVPGGDSPGFVPSWFPLILLAIFLFFSAQQEMNRQREQPEDEGPFGYDFSQGYTSLERDDQAKDERSPDPVSRWFEQRRQARLQQQAETEVEEDRRVDEILARLHEIGMKNLSAEDRALLQRVSARYRSREIS